MSGIIPNTRTWLPRFLGWPDLPSSGDVWAIATIMRWQWPH